MGSASPLEEISSRLTLEKGLKQRTIKRRGLVWEEYLLTMRFPTKTLAKITLLAAVVLPGFAQTNRTTCSFNGRREACAVNGWANGNGNVANIAVTWLTDGKQTFYALSTDGVFITEDNGRPSLGSWRREGGGFVINSSRGNTTVIPWQD
jgi:hypothetical protein